jgi:hypothetical protein
MNPSQDVINRNVASQAPRYRLSSNTMYSLDPPIPVRCQVAFRLWQGEQVRLPDEALALLWFVWALWQVLNGGGCRI